MQKSHHEKEPLTNFTPANRSIFNSALINPVFQRGETDASESPSTVSTVRGSIVRPSTASRKRRSFWPSLREERCSKIICSVLAVPCEADVRLPCRFPIPCSQSKRIGALTSTSLALHSCSTRSNMKVTYYLPAHSSYFDDRYTQEEVDQAIALFQMVCKPDKLGDIPEAFVFLTQPGKSVAPVFESSEMNSPDPKTEERWLNCTMKLAWGHLKFLVKEITQLIDGGGGSKK